MTDGRCYVLVPGAGGAAAYWHRVVPLLRERGHEAVAVGLPAADERKGLEAYADAILAATGDRDDVVLVAQSMGGFSAPLACARRRYAGLILVNAMIPAPGETAGQWWDATGQGAARREMDERDGRDPDAPFDLLTCFFHDVPEDVTAAAMREPQPQADRPFGDPWPLAAWPDVPTRVITACDDRFFPAEFQARVARQRLGIEPETLPGGHLVALSRPGELTELLCD